MLVLLGTTVTASFFDSLNPSAIAQQLLLQAMVKNKRYIWFFIFGIGLANFVMGVGIYFGVTAQLLQLWEQSVLRYPLLVRIVELFTGSLCLAAGIRMLARIKKCPALDTESTAKIPEYQLTPAALFFMGVGFCAVELTSALPYFGFLALLTGYQLAVPYVLGLILLYTFIYAFPLILLYLGYNRLCKTVLITRLEKALSRISAYILPAAFIILGAVLGINSGQALLLLK